jgi:hypothetical protein
MFKPALYVKAHYNPEDNTLSVKTQDTARFIQVRSCGGALHAAA